MTAAWQVVKRLLPGVLIVVALVGLLFVAHQRGATVEAAAGALRLSETKTRHQGEMATLRAELATHRADAEERQRAIEHQRANDFEKVTQDAQAQIDLAQRDAAAAHGLADSLRKQARAVALTCSPGPYSAAGSSASIAASGQAASSPGNVLADVFGWADQAAGTLAEAYDRARAAGLACERAYQAVRGK